MDNINKTNPIDFIQFIRQETNIYDLQISEHTTIENDMGVTGAEAFDLIEAIGKKYDVDISQFKFNKYFGQSQAFL